jgi:hypothetical protein
MHGRSAPDWTSGLARPVRRGSNRGVPLDCDHGGWSLGHHITRRLPTVWPIGRSWRWPRLSWRAPQRRPDQAWPALVPLPSCRPQIALRRSGPGGPIRHRRLDQARITTVTVQVTWSPILLGSSGSRRVVGRIGAGSVLGRDEQAIARWVKADWPRIRALGDVRGLRGAGEVTLCGTDWPPTAARRLVPGCAVSSTGWWWTATRPPARAEPARDATAAAASGGQP